jgi:hypothetical protein
VVGGRARPRGCAVRRFLAVGELTSAGRFVAYIAISIALIAASVVLIGRAARWPPRRIRAGVLGGVLSGVVWFVLVGLLLYVALLGCAAENEKCLS